MKKFWISCTAAVLALVFVFTIQSNTLAATGNWSVYVSIYKTRNHAYSQALSVTSKHMIVWQVATHNNIDMKWYIKDTKTGVIIKRGKRTSQGVYSGKIYGLTNQYRLYLQCDDNYWYSFNNNNKCDGDGSLANYIMW
ncbi:hypothetical protein MK805_01935 [Shimazuella sp. AN120528]|uniref:hypothetical protein n=1 Tax=Shimazuella soli TaxID=1892854 RepID=UPI001F107B2B|nr:hypothetical protein [Shimazuella soli]MCH5583728.1 hypothetical protein [Shimazuella soli]